MQRAFLEMKLSKHQKRINSLEGFILEAKNATGGNDAERKSYYGKFSLTDYKKSLAKNEEAALHAKHEIIELRK